VTKWCPICRRDLPEDAFARRRGTGRQSRCRECNKAYLKQHYQQNPEYYAEKAKRTKLRLKRANHVRLLAYFAEHPCVDCGETDPVVLQFDHVRGTKEACVGKLVRDGRRWELIEAEIEKCEVRCSNCHWRRTAKQFNWYAYFKGDE
jgi:hypothetical protein